MKVTYFYKQFHILYPNYWKNPREPPIEYDVNMSPLSMIDMMVVVLEMLYEILKVCVLSLKEF